MHFAGVWCKKPLKKGQKFGPFAGKITRVVTDGMDASYVWEVSGICAVSPRLRVRLSLSCSGVVLVRRLPIRRQINFSSSSTQVMHGEPTGCVMSTVRVTSKNRILCQNKKAPIFFSRLLGYRNHSKTDISFSLHTTYPSSS